MAHAAVSSPASSPASSHVSPPTSEDERLAAAAVDAEAVPADQTTAESRDVRVSDESALLAGLRAGDAVAFEQLVRTYSPRLLAVARRISGSDEDARDVVQDAFLNAFRSLANFHGDARLSTWLHRIVVNSALMKLRTRRRKPEESIEPLLPAFLADGHFAERFSSWGDGADQLVVRQETQALVRRYIDELPESYRTVLVLRDIEGLDTEDTARVLDTTTNAVKIRLHRARAALRTLLAPHVQRGEL